MTIYVVIGACGEFSDRNEWVAMAFRTEGAAVACVEAATKRAKEMAAMSPRDQDARNEHDPNMAMDYAGRWDPGTHYWYQSIELEDR